MTQNKHEDIVLFDWKNCRFRSQRSSMTPGFLGDGEVTQAVNFRFDSGAMTVRYGTALDYASTGLSGTILGAVRNYLGAWVAMNDGGTTKVYQWGGSSWTEISDGTTRITGTSLVEFEFITEPIYTSVADFNDTNNVYVVWQNGVDVPRIRNAKAGGSYSSRLHQRLTEPKAVMCKAQFVPVQYFLTQGTLTHTNDGSGHVVFTAPSVSTGGKNLLLTCDTSATSSHYATTQFNSGNISFSSAPSQIQIVYKTSDEFIWSKLRVSLLTTGGTQYVLHDPTLNTFVKTVVIDDVYSMAIIDIDTVYDSSLTLVTTGLPTSTNFDRFSLKWADSSSPSASTTLNIYSITFGMAVRPSVQAKVAYFGSNSRSESRGVVCETQPMQLLKDVGGTPIPGLRLSGSPLATYRLKVYSHKRRSLSANATRLIAYIQTAAGEDFYQALQDPTDISSTDDSAIVQITVDSEDTILRTCPDEKYESIPIGSSMTIMGTRLVVGNARPPGAAASYGNGQVWLSDHDYKHRFSEVVRVAADGSSIAESAVAFKIANAQITAVKTIPAQLFGVDSVFVFSTTSVWSIHGSDSSTLSRPYKQSDYGTRAPRSIACWGGSLYYLDTYRQVRVMTGRDSGQVLSRMYVDDKLAGIPDARIPNVSAVFHDDRYYLAYTPSGSSLNENILIFDMRIQGWYTDSTSASIKYEILHAVEENTKRKIFFTHTDGKFYQHENSSATDDIGTAITARVKFREINADYLAAIYFGRVGMVADVASGKTFSVYRHAKQSTTSATASTLDIGTSTTGLNVVSRFDRNASTASNEDGRADLGLQVEVSGALASGTKVYKIWVEARLGGSVVDTA